MLDDTQEIGAGSGGRVESHDIRGGEAERFSQTGDEEIIDQSHLGADDLDRGVVDAGVLAQLGIVGGEEIFVEVEPGVSWSCEQGTRHDGDDPQQQVERSGDFRARSGIGQDLQGAGQQTVLRGESGLGTVEGERIGSLATAQQQGERDGLGIGIGELIVRCVREEKMPPVRRQLEERRLGILERVGHVVAQHPTQRRQQRCEALEVDLPTTVQRQERFPREEVAQNRFQGADIVCRNSLPAVAGDIARETNELSGAFAAAVERPFVAVGIENVGDGREAVELVAVMAPEAGRVRTRAGRLDLDVSGEQSVSMDGVVRTPETIGQGRFTRTDDVLAPGSGHARQEVLEGAAKLVLRCALDQWRRLGGDRFGEVL